MFLYERESENALKYMRSDLKEEYERLINEYPDLLEFKQPILNVSDILRAYFILADYFTDTTADEKCESMLIGVRDVGLLISALGRQTVGYMGRVKYSNPIDICATLFFGLIKDHAFLDGNKRTALLSLLYQLDLFGYRPNSSNKEFEKLVVAVAGNELKTVYPKIWKRVPKQQKTNEADYCVGAISRILAKMVKKKDNSFHMDVTARDLIRAINGTPDCTCSIEGTKIKVQRKICRKVWFWKSNEDIKTYSVPYRGETRLIGAATIRELLNELEIYEQYPNYLTFFEGDDPRYMLISNFEGPLRRLKDK